MAYLYKKQKGKNNYYCLRISKRIGKRVIAKDICNLGKEISKISLKKLIQKYPEIKNSEKNIRKKIKIENYLNESKKHKLNENKYFTREQLFEINACLRNYKEKYKKLNFKRKRDILRKVYIKFSVESASIEENTINLKEAEEMFRFGIYPKNKSMKEIFNLLNTLNILYFIENKKNIKLKLINEIHHKLLENVNRIKSYRNYELKTKTFAPSKSKTISSELNKLLSWYNKNNTKIHPLALAILFHHKFEKIYPFSTGNGEVGRILMNHILYLHNYPLIIIPSKLKQEYLNSLNKADKAVKKDLLSTDMRYYDELINFIYKQFVKTYWENFVV